MRKIFVFLCCNISVFLCCNISAMKTSISKDNNQRRLSVASSENGLSNESSTLNDIVYREKIDKKLFLLLIELGKSCVLSNNFIKYIFGFYSYIKICFLFLMDFIIFTKDGIVYYINRVLICFMICVFNLL